MHFLEESKIYSPKKEKFIKDNF